MSKPWVGEVTDFWFSLDPKQWWTSDPQLDAEVKERFFDLWQSEQQRPGTDFLGSPADALAAVILFDQLPRNMHRGHADSFATDPMALGIAKAAIEQSQDEQLSPAQRGILYMPFQHSEEIEDQRRSVALFTALSGDQVEFAKKHHDVIERFGRFPHRNEMLGRTPRPDEVAASDVTPW